MGVHIGSKAGVRNRGVGAVDEGGHLPIADPAVAIGVGRSVKTRAYLVAEHAGLHARPFVALPGRRRRQEETHRLSLGQRPELGETVDLVAPTAGPALQRQEIRVASVDDHVGLIGVDSSYDLRFELERIETSVLESDVPAPVFHVAVAGVDEIEDGLDTPLSSLLYVPGEKRGRSVEVGPRR